MSQTNIIIHGDCLEVLKDFEDNSVDLVFTSPPYEDARTYSIDFKLKGQDWVDWALTRFVECLRVSRGLVAWVVEGKTKQFRYTATPILLMADLHRAGVHLRKPPAFHRVGIPGSGGPDWLRNDYEFIVCATSGGKLPWSDNVAMGGPCKYATGGKLSYRNKDGLRANHRRGYHSGGSTQKKQEQQARPKIANPGNVIYSDFPKIHLRSLNIIDIIECYEQCTQRNTDEILRDLRHAIATKTLFRWWARVYSRIQEAAILQSYMQGNSPTITKRPENGRIATSRQEDCEKEKAKDSVRGLRKKEQAGSSSLGRGRNKQRDGKSGSSMPLVSPEETQTGGLQDSRLRKAFSCPGVLFDSLPEIQEIWRSVGKAIESTSSPAESTNVIHCVVGGGNMGSKLSSLSEAPFPEKLAEFFIRSFCPPKGTVLDPYSGSGTTCAVAEKTGRKWIGIDIRESQTQLTTKRIKEAKLIEKELFE